MPVLKSLTKYRTMRKKTRRSPAGVGRRALAPLRTGGYFGPLMRRKLGELKTVDVDPATYVA